VRRRRFIAGFAAAGVWPSSLIAQRSTAPVIGFLDTATPGRLAPFLAAFRQGLMEAGFLEGRDVLVEYRWAENHNERLPTLAADLVQLQVAVIVGSNLQSALAARDATKITPIVFGIGGDPVELGLVASLSRPGGNVTGITLQSIDAFGKRLQLLRELIPEARSIAFLTNPTNKQNAEDEVREAQNAGRTLGLQSSS
jgi:putative tryptophan/tyrosine transport system substrate-binding protein